MTEKIETAPRLTASFRKDGDWMRVTRYLDNEVCAEESYPYLGPTEPDEVITRLTTALRNEFNGFNQGISFQAECDRLVRDSLFDYRRENKLWWALVKGYLREFRGALIQNARKYCRRWHYRSLQSGIQTRKPAG